ncbi:MAG: phosphodiester glycosidase family protein [Anaerolineae bacterium]
MAKKVIVLLLVSVLYSVWGGTSLAGPPAAPTPITTPAVRASPAEEAIQYSFQDDTHILRIDLTNPNIRFRTVLSNDGRGGCEKVSSMARRYEALLAINADYFPNGCPWPEGMTYINGVDYTMSLWPVKSWRSSLAISENNEVSIGIGEKGREKYLHNVVGGGPQFVKEGRYVWEMQYFYEYGQRKVLVNGERFGVGASQWPTVHKAWNAVGLTRDGKTLIIALSPFKNAPEMAELLISQGAWTAMKLDSGGSATLYYKGKVLMGDKKPVANALLIIPRRDETPPQGHITALEEGAFLNGESIYLSARAEDDSGVREVQFYALYNGDWHLLHTDEEPPYGFLWELPPIEDQEILFSIHVVDEAGNKVEDAGGVRRARLDRTPPALSSPAVETHGAPDGLWQSKVQDPAFTWPEAVDETSGTAGYNVYWGPDPEGTSDFWTESRIYDPGLVAPGVYYLRLRAEDRAGNLSAWETVFTFKLAGK